MKSIFRRFSIAIVLALLAGLSMSNATQAQPAKSEAVVVMQSFRSTAKYDGFVTEYADDYWVGGKFNSTSASILIGDEYTKKLNVGILDFDTSLLPDTANIIGAYLELYVLKYNTLFGDPYLLLGDLYAEFISPYYGMSPMLENQDFEWFSAAYAGVVAPATKPNQRILLEVDPAVVWQISATQRTQFKLYFWDDNEDQYSQGITIASGNHTVVAYRPLLTIYFSYP